MPRSDHAESIWVVLRFGMLDDVAIPLWETRLQFALGSNDHQARSSPGNRVMTQHHLIQGIFFQSQEYAQMMLIKLNCSVGEFICMLKSKKWLSSTLLCSVPGCPYSKENALICGWSQLSFSSSNHLLVFLSSQKASAQQRGKHCSRECQQHKLKHMVIRVRTSSSAQGTSSLLVKGALRNVSATIYHILTENS